VDGERQHQPEHGQHAQQHQLLALDGSGGDPPGADRGGDGRHLASPSSATAARAASRAVPSPDPSPAAAARTSAWEAPRPKVATIDPARTTSTLSASSSTSSRSEETTSTAVPWSARARICLWISSLAPTSTPWVGSSSTTTPGRSTSWRASTTFCWFPPDRALTGVCGPGALMAMRLMRSAATCCSRWRSTHTRNRRSRCRWATEMLKAMLLIPKTPWALRLPGSRAIPARAAACGVARLTGSPLILMVPLSAGAIPKTGRGSGPGPRAEQAVDGHDLARPHGEAHVLEAAAAAEAADLEGRLDLGGHPVAGRGAGGAVAAH